MSLRQTVLHERHTHAGAKMADFGGWEMPIEYEGVVAEHTGVREACGIFDVSHMGKIRITGAGSGDFLNSLLTNDVDRLGLSQAQYTMLCSDGGGVIDDLIVYRLGEQEYFLIPNAANAADVLEVLRAAAPEGITITDQHLDLGIIAVQGPAAPDVVASLGLPTEHEYMSVAMGEFRGAPLMVCRTGYTGERGYELIAPTDTLVELWDALGARRTEFGVVRAGLGARDTLRTEMGYPLHGQDLSLDISPLQAGMAWAVGWKKPEFAGRDALMREREEGPRRILRGLLGRDRGIPRPHMAVHSGGVDGPQIGEVTSGTFSPTLKQGIALALMDPAVDIGDEVVVDVRGRPAVFTVVRPPFVDASPKTPSNG
jgi:aminomethyltransferase